MTISEIKKKIEELKTQFKEEGINLTELWRGIQASVNMLIVIGILLFMFPKGENFSDDYATGFATGAFLIFMMVSPPVIYYFKKIINFLKRR